MVKAEICERLMLQKVLFSITTTQIIFLIYSQTSSLIANGDEQKRQKEGKGSGRKRTASIEGSDKEKKKV